MSKYDISCVYDASCDRGLSTLAKISTISRHFGSLQLYLRQLVMKVAKGCMPKCMEIALDCSHVSYILYIGYHIDIVIIMLIIAYVLLRLNTTSTYVSQGSVPVMK